MAGGMYGWGGMCGGGHVWHRGMHGGGVHGRRDSHCSRRYASYWNAFLFCSGDEVSSVQGTGPGLPLYRDPSPGHFKLESGRLALD